MLCEGGLSLKILYCFVHTDSMDTQGKQLVYISSYKEPDRVRLHHTTQNSAQCTIYQFFYLGNFPFSILQPWVTKTVETSDKGGLLCNSLINVCQALY